MLKDYDAPELYGTPDSVLSEPSANSSTSISLMPLADYGESMKVEYVFWIIFAFAIATTIVRIVRNGGWRGAMFGAPIRSTVAEIVLKKQGMAKRRIKIHQLAGNHDGPQVGIEIAFSMPGAFSIYPVSLTAEEARQLATAVEQALR